MRIFFKKMLFIALFLFSIFLSISGLFSAFDPDKDIPEYGDLVFIEGALASSSKTEYQVEIILSGTDNRFHYLSKSDEMPAVWDSLYKGAIVKIGYELDDSDPYTVFDISVDDKTIRSYTQIKEAWVSDNNLGWVFIIFFLPMGIFFWKASREPDKYDIWF